MSLNSLLDEECPYKKVVNYKNKGLPLFCMVYTNFTLWDNQSYRNTFWSFSTEKRQNVQYLAARYCTHNDIDGIPLYIHFVDSALYNNRLQLKIWKLHIVGRILDTGNNLTLSTCLFVCPDVHSDHTLQSNAICCLDMRCARRPPPAHLADLFLSLLVFPVSFFPKIVVFRIDMPLAKKKSSVMFAASPSNLTLFLLFVSFSLANQIKTFVLVFVVSFVFRVFFFEIHWIFEWKHLNYCPFQLFQPFLVLFSHFLPFQIIFSDLSVFFCHF